MNGNNSNASKTNSPVDETEMTDEEKRADEELDRLRFEVMTKVEKVYYSACQKYPAMKALDNLQWVSGGTGAPMSIDAERLYVSPFHIIDMTPDQIEFLLRHEFGHVVLNHAARCSAFLAEINDPDNWGIWLALFGFGADLEVNSGLIDESMKAGMHDATLPGHGAYKEFPVGLTAEEYVLRIMDMPDLLKSDYLENNVLSNLDPIDPSMIPSTYDMVFVLAQVEHIRRCKWRHIARRIGARRELFLAQINDPQNEKVLRKLFAVSADLEINSELIDKIEKLGRQTDPMPEHGDYDSFPLGLTAEEYAQLIMASPELMMKIRALD